MKTLSIVIPCLNEERALPVCVRQLSAYLSERMSEYDWRILIWDNGSTDRTREVGNDLDRSCDRVHYHRSEIRGRGGAVIDAWMGHDADIHAFMDVDLSTDLSSFPVLIQTIASGDADVAVGSRWHPDSVVTGRSLKRRITGRGYHLLFRALSRTGAHDPNCGFKAVSRAVVAEAVPQLVSRTWFFDAELIMVSHHLGYRVVEVPVRWADDPDSRVRVVRAAAESLRGMLRMNLGGFRQLRKPQA